MVSFLRKMEYLMERFAGERKGHWLPPVHLSYFIYEVCTDHVIVDSLPSRPRGSPHIDGKDEKGSIQGWIQLEAFCLGFSAPLQYSMSHCFRSALPQPLRSAEKTTVCYHIDSLEHWLPCSFPPLRQGVVLPLSFL